MRLELGPPTNRLAPSSRIQTLNVFPDGMGQPGFGIGFHYYP